MAARFTHIARSLMIAAAVATALASTTSAQTPSPPPAAPQTLFIHVNVFDGEHEQRIENANVLVEGNKIKTMSTQAIMAAGATVIDGGDGTLMPGIIEAHAHLALAGVTFNDVLNELPGYVTIYSTVIAKQMLMNGVTSVRDLGGEVFSLKRAVDEGAIPGPRIYPSGAMISQTSGHADYRNRNEFNPSLGGGTPGPDQNHYSSLVDGVPKMRAAVREQLRLGASQIKLAIGGGVASPTDPIDVTEFSKEEIAAAVDAAANWGTYVTVHGYTSRAINQAIDAGVRVIEHGQLLDRKTLERMATDGVWLSTQPFTECNEPGLSPAQNEKQAIVCKGTAQVYEWIKEMPSLKVAHGTDIFISPGPGIGVREEVKQMERLLKWFTPFEILKMSTSNVGELLKLSGPRNPYPGDLGVVKEGAYADLLLVDGNPLEDITKVTRQENIKIIMKDGKVYKNTVK